LVLVRKPVWAEASKEAREALGECIGISATRAVNREMGVRLPAAPWREEEKAALGVSTVPPANLPSDA
jgi:hypothetical protein